MFSSREDGIIVVSDKNFATQFELQLENDTFSVPSESTSELKVAASSFQLINTTKALCIDDYFVFNNTKSPLLSHN
jgi:hypothetical protein